MASNSPAPFRFAFSANSKTLTKPVMEFTGGSISDAGVDIYSFCTLHSIQLYTYDWTIHNYSMIKSVSEPIASPIFRVGPFQNMEMKLFLWRIGDNVKIEVQLSKEVKLTDEMKAKEASCPLSSKVTKNVLDLEFIDSTGKTIDYYISLPYEFKYINTSRVYSWAKEESASRFINDDSLTIRAKLSIRYYSHEAEIHESSCVKSTKVLIDDMKSLFNDRSRFPDVVIKVGGQFIFAHKSILFTQCPSFAEMEQTEEELKAKDQGILPFNMPNSVSSNLAQDYATLYIRNEKADVFLSVLHFIYCRQLDATDSVNDFAVYEFAKKYGVRELSMLLMPSEIKVRSEVKQEKLTYTFYVKNFSSLCKTGFSPIQSPDFKTAIVANINWCVVVYCLDSQNIILNLQRNSGFDLDIQTTFKLQVCKADGSTYDEKEFKHLFVAGNNCHPGFVNAVSRFLITPDLLHNDTLTVCCDLIVANGGITSELKHIYRGEYPDIDLAYWTRNFKDLLGKQNFSDATLKVEDEEFKIHKAVVAARSPVFARMFESDMEEKRSGCVKIEDIGSIVMKQALVYIYTGEISDLTMAHAPELYRTADKYEIMDLKTRCSEFIMKNMDAENACEVLILSDLYNDEKMKKAAKNIICRNAAQALLSPHGIELITNHSILAHDILESLSAVFCSLPPQDAFERSPVRFGTAGIVNNGRPIAVGVRAGQSSNSRKLPVSSLMNSLKI